MILKNKLKIAFGVSMSAISVASVALIAVSCHNDDKVQEVKNNAYKFYDEFTNGTHGRWAGNYANFIPSTETSRSEDIGKNTFGQYGLNQANLKLAGFENCKEIKLTHTYDKNKELSTNDPDGIGSHYAYEWLIAKLKDFGLQDNGGQYSVSKETNKPVYPTESTVTINGNKLTLAAGSNAVLKDSAEGDRNVVAISTTTSDKPYFQQTGYITQGYLWNGSDRITKKKVANQYDQNIIVTIKALDKDGKPKFAPVTTNEANGVERNAFWITAHYDSTGTEGINSKSWGATDNASGVGAALDLIEFYKNDENAKTLKADLNIAFVGGEEVGVTGSTALVEQFLNGTDDKVNKAQVGGMLNLDTAAGGDNLYVHSPWTDLYEIGKDGQLSVTSTNKEGAALGTLVRDQLNSISKMQATSVHDENAELQIHPFITPVEGAEGYLQGQTGDWSDHAPFYKLGISNVAYIEATNFQIDGNSGYDGYSQTSNKVAWTYKKQVFENNAWKDVRDENNNLITKPGTPVESLLDGQPINVWGPGEDDFKPFTENDKKYRWARYNSGAIWHWDIDTPQFMKKEFGDRMERQLTNLGATLRTFFTTMNISTFNQSLNQKTPAAGEVASLALNTNLASTVVNSQSINFNDARINRLQK